MNFGRIKTKRSAHHHYGRFSLMDAVSIGFIFYSPLDNRNKAKNDDAILFEWFCHFTSML